MRVHAVISVIEGFAKTIKINLQRKALPLAVGHILLAGMMIWKIYCFILSLLGVIYRKDVMFSNLNSSVFLSTLAYFFFQSWVKQKQSVPDRTKLVLGISSGMLVWILSRFRQLWVNHEMSSLQKREFQKAASVHCHYKATCFTFQEEKRDLCDRSFKQYVLQLADHNCSTRVLQLVYASVQVWIEVNNNFRFQI